MILTLNPNTAIDYTLKVDRFELNTTLRAETCAWGMGGKAADAAWILGKLGVPVLTLGFAAGETGLRMQSMLQEHGVQTDLVWVDGDTRLNVVIACASQGQTTVTVPGLKVSAHQASELLARYQLALETACCVVIGGSLPQGVSLDFYTTAIGMARQRGLPVIFDASGATLAAGLTARPSLIKPNRDELATLLGHRPGTRQETLQAVVKVCRLYGVDMVLTLGAEGAAACLDGNLSWIKPLVVPVESVAGAGDGVLAGLALAMARQEPPERGLRYGFALAGAIVQTLATADFKLDDYEQLLPRVEIETISSPDAA